MVFAAELAGLGLFPDPLSTIHRSKRLNQAQNSSQSAYRAERRLRSSSVHVYAVGLM